MQHGDANSCDAEAPEAMEEESARLRKESAEIELNAAQKETRIAVIDERIRNAGKEYLTTISLAKNERLQVIWDAADAEAKKRRTDEIKAKRSTKGNLRKAWEAEQKARIEAAKPLSERDQYLKDMSIAMAVPDVDPRVAKLNEELKALRMERSVLMGECDGR